MVRRMTQKDKILAYMRTYGAITPVDAMREFSCMRLGARIADLKKDGYSIHTEMVGGRNKFGEATHYAAYSLTGKGNGLD